MTLDNEVQREVLLRAFLEAGFPGMNKIAVAVVQQAVEGAAIAGDLVPGRVTAPNGVARAPDPEGAASA
jgi:hypothetical protein